MDISHHLVLIKLKKLNLFKGVKMGKTAVKKEKKHPAHTPRDRIAVLEMEEMPATQRQVYQAVKKRAMDDRGVSQKDNENGADPQKKRKYKNATRVAAMISRKETKKDGKDEYKYQSKKKAVKRYNLGQKHMAEGKKP
jgi:hypothetical protein